VDVALQAWVALQVTKMRVRDRIADQRGEGVISTAIAVLIMALIGLLMWTVFQRVFNDAGTRIESNVNDIG
jgi:phosphotransferase system  glucose/maltose/N-acetylglucosamine-specific IIC component